MDESNQGTNEELPIVRRWLHRRLGKRSARSRTWSAKCQCFSKQTKYLSLISTIRS